MMKREDISRERQLVLKTAVEMDDSQVDELRKALEGNVDWSEVIYQMVTHRTLNMFRYNLKKFNLYDSLEKELQRLMDMQWMVFEERNSYYRQKLGEILKEFEKRSLIVPVLKGNLLASLVYPAIESRIFNDLDMLMQLDDVEAVVKALEELGYIQGNYDEQNDVIVEVSRKKKVLHQMATHEIHQFLKLSDNKFAKLVEVDVNHDILWKGNCPYSVPTKDLIKRAIPVEICDTKGYMLDYIDNIIQLSCHLYKEACLMIWIASLKDLKIYKFADLYMYIRKFSGLIDWNMLVERVKEYKLDKIVYYNFYYIELMFGEIVPQSVMNSLKPEDLSYLDEYAVENKEPSKWEFDFFTRLFDVNRILSIDRNKAEGMTRFLDAKFS
ncbi:MAG TPA: nucleotidyltransferase family protein [Clostridia bacterium]|nr:nucleotidyltransferase family protein [Clostridia bacterium]